MCLGGWVLATGVSPPTHLSITALQAFKNWFVFTWLGILLKCTNVMIYMGFISVHLFSFPSFPCPPYNAFLLASPQGSRTSCYHHLYCDDTEPPASAMQLVTFPGSGGERVCSPRAPSAHFRRKPSITREPDCY